MGTVMCTRISGLLPAILLALAMAAPSPAQTGTSVVSVRVDASIKGATFWADGQEYTSSGQFLWSLGSKHTLEIRNKNQVFPDGKSRVTFTRWSDEAGLILATDSTTQVITVDSSNRSYTATFQLEYLVNYYVNSDQPVNLFDPSSINYPEIGIPNPYGFISTSTRACIQTSSWEWVSAGTVLTLNAVPYPGKVFVGWDVPPGPSDTLSNLSVDGPKSIRAKFIDARRVYIDSYPQIGLKVVVDRTVMYARGDKCFPDWTATYSPVSGTGSPVPPDYPYPINIPPSSFPDAPVGPYSYCTQIPLCNGELDLQAGTPHIFAAPASQTDRMGNLWVFDHWDFGNGQTGGLNSTVTIPEDWSTQTYTAHFVKGIRSSFVTMPTGLKLKIDGRDNWASYNFEWGLGHTHTVSAPPDQVDARGRRYRFVSWSNGGTPDQEITITDTEGTASFRMIAQYEMLGQLSIQSDPAALTFDVSGATCTTPCVLDRPAGTSITVTPVPEMPYSADTKATLLGWADGAAAGPRNYTFGQEAAVMAAKYTYFQKLTAISDPDGGATWVYDPMPSAGNYFPAGTKVSVTVEAAQGYKFKRFEGALSGALNYGWLNMNTPATVVARLDKVPALADNAVKNAAGDTPTDGVAPGSLISITGFNMTADYVKGADSPLAQTLQGVVVQLPGSRYLPLVSVAPDRIIGQLPSDYAEGEYTLTVRSPGQAALSTKFKVKTYAPGLFRRGDATDEVPLVLALHADGTEVTPESPARAGETVSLFGTGFGPLNPAPLDGFAVPANPPVPLKDAAELLIGGEVRPYVWCGAAAGRVGYWVMQFKIDSTMGQAQNVAVQVRVNGQPSNSVVLPLH
ncbi:InlB B-repeat-containing protein [Paludibaculum fermentans]|uniref:InlB B-repeat-containing protein n=1 Tax=Paludibaculum fermentans TaxID=1473598 RepID=UPI003EC041B7